MTENTSAIAAEVFERMEMISVRRFIQKHELGHSILIQDSGGWVVTPQSCDHTAIKVIHRHVGKFVYSKEKP